MIKLNIDKCKIKQIFYLTQYEELLWIEKVWATDALILLSAKVKVMFD